MSLLNLSPRRPSGRRADLRDVVPCAQALEARSLFSAGTSVIDVMIVYTPQALADAGGSVSALEGRMHRSVADMNLALANSHVNASVRLVHDAEVNYRESGVIAQDLNNLQSGAAGLGGVAALRNVYGADIVSLWVGSGSGNEAGRAFQPDDPTVPRPDLGFNVVQEQYADDNFVFAHEMAHNLGAGHDRSDTSPRSIPYAYGKVFTIGNDTVGDIMSEGVRAGYYSNPNVSFDGIPTGNPDNSAQPADNARVMNLFAPTVAHYRPTVVPDAAPPSAALEAVSVDAARQTLTVKVQYADDTAVSVGSLGTGDVLVTGPGGFRKLAVYQGVDFSSDGPQRVATYTTSVAGSSLDPAAYTFALEPNRVRDTSGHAAAATTLVAPTLAFPNRAGPRTVTAFTIGTLANANWETFSAIDADDPTAFYQFTLTSPQQFTAHLSGLTASVNELLVQDRNADGYIQDNEILSYPYRTGTSPETISQRLSAGTYEMWIAPTTAGASSHYALSLSAAPVAPAPAAAGGTLAGTVFDDANANARYDAGESGLAGWRVYVDARHTGVYAAADPSALTDRFGNYRITNVPAGAGVLRIVEPPGWRSTLPAGIAEQPFTLGAAQVLSENFAQTQQGVITGVLFNDLNHDGRRESSEPALAGWRVVLDEVGSSVSRTVATTSQGAWTFDDLSPGTYTVRLISPAGWRLTTPGAYTIKIFPARVADGLAFGILKL